MVIIGGSVANGGGCRSYLLGESEMGSFGGCSWAKRFVTWMRTHFSNPHITLHPLTKPATTTTWALAHFDRIANANPDLVLVDYGVNDPIVSSTEQGRFQYAGMMRAATELLIRRILTLRRDNPVALLYFVLQRSFDKDTYYFPDEVYYPVCRAYGVPVVSARDAIWPHPDVVRHNLWPTANGAHPLWQAHQIVADLGAFAMIEAEEGYLPRRRDSEPVQDLHGDAYGVAQIKNSTLRFRAEESQALGACPSGYLAVIEGSSSRLLPTRNGGWKFVVQNGKAGWVYDLASTERTVSFSILCIHLFDVLSKRYVCDTGVSPAHEIFRPQH